MRVLHARACVVAHLESLPEGPDCVRCLEAFQVVLALKKACNASQSGAKTGGRGRRRRRVPQRSSQSKDSPTVNADFLIAAHHQAIMQLKPLCLHAWRMEFGGKKPDLI